MGNTATTIAPTTGNASRNGMVMAKWRTERFVGARAVASCSAANDARVRSAGHGEILLTLRPNASTLVNALADRLHGTHDVERAVNFVATSEPLPDIVKRAILGAKEAALTQLLVESGAVKHVQHLLLEAGE